MTQRDLAFGIDIGGTNTKIGLFNISGTLISFTSHPTKKDIPAEAFIKELAAECDAIVQKEFGIRLGDPRIAGVGAGAPMANYFTGSVEFAPNLGWRNVPLRDLFKTHFKAHALIENDANLAAVGENKWGAGKDLRDFVLVTLGTGVGTGLILNEKLYRGHGALGGEGGHILIPHTKHRLCSCGGMNHLESYLSAKGIKQTIKELTQEDWTIEKLGQLFAEGDLRARTIIDAVAEELASGLVNMAVLLGPEAFVIGGGVSKLGQSFFDVIEKKIDEVIHFSLKGKVKVRSASVSAEKGAVFGGAALIFDEV